MLWIFGFGVVVAVAAVDNNQVKTGFSCEGRTTGYYADVDSGCQVYHMCDGLGRQFSYTCPNATLFQQRMLICDHWYMVNCSKSVDDYAANLRIGRKMPFVDDSESNPYHRTPRPDLLSHPSQSEYDIIYRTGRAQFGTNLNLVGAESGKTGSSSTTDEPTYSLPSHWSTEYDQHSTTFRPKTESTNKKEIIDTNTKVEPVSSINTVTEVPVNYKSSFKATTPVFPLSVETTSVAPDAAGVVPPLPYQLVNRTDTNPEIPTELPPQNVPTATPAPVNFKSEFKATTPVYPLTVDVTSEEPSDVGVLPPNSINGSDGSQEAIPTLILDFQAPAVDPNFNPANHTNETEPVLPSKFYQPPKFEPDYTEVKQEPEQRQGGFKVLDNSEWESLRKKFLIPDYEFPLETVSRPSYDSVLSSFQAGEVPSTK